MLKNQFYGKVLDIGHRDATSMTDGRSERQTEKEGLYNIMVTILSFCDSATRVVGHRSTVFNLF